jgi:hypothetical protein
MGRELMDSANVAGSKAPMAFSQSVGFFELPGHPVSFGEKWNAETIDSTAVGEGFTAKIAAIEYTLTGTEPKNGHDCLKIEFTSKNEMTGKMKQMGMDVFIEGTGDTKGTIWFDAKAGLMILRESTTVQDITYAMSGSMTMTIPMTQSIKSSHSLVE